MARTYKRDGNGRFAGGGGGGGGKSKRPAAKQVQRGTNRLTRDNAGRITSVGGDGATARGGRIRTAAGNLRATTTAKIGRTKASGTVAKPRGLKADKNAAVKLATNQRLRARAAARGIDMAKVQTSKTSVRAKQGGGTAARIQPAAKPARVSAAKPKELNAQDKKPLANRVLIRGNFRPQNVMANPAPDKTIYYKNQKGKNIAALEDIAKKAGANTQVVTKRKQKLAIAMASKAMNLVRLNKASDFYANPRQLMRAQRRMGQLSTTDPRGIAFHELGHLRQKKKSENIFTQREFSSPRNARLAGRVSEYAKTNANEFAAETYAGLKTGRRYDSQVMRAYREEMGLRPLSIRRQQQKKGVSSGFVSPRAKTAKPAATPKPANAARPKVNLSTSAFEKRAKDARARASSASNAVKFLDRSDPSPSNRKAFAKANALQMASDRYSSVLRKSKNSEFTTAEVFKGINRRYSTAPKLSPSEKAARTKAANKAKTLEKNIKAQEQARRYGR